MLQTCVQEEIAEIGTNPLVQQLGLSPILGAFDVARDQQDLKDVNISATLSSHQTHLIMTLLGILEGS